MWKHPYLERCPPALDQEGKTRKTKGNNKIRAVVSRLGIDRGLDMLQKWHLHAKV